MTLVNIYKELCIHEHGDHFDFAKVSFQTRP